MACATLKRPIEFDPLHSPNPSKRPRCMPMCISPSNSPPRNLSSPPRPSINSSGASTNGCGVGGGNILLNNAYSPFVSRMAKLSPEAIASGIFEEMKRLHRRKELHIPSSSIHHHAAAMLSTSSANHNSSHHAHLHALAHPHPHLLHPSLVSNLSNSHHLHTSGSAVASSSSTSTSVAASSSSGGGGGPSSNSTGVASGGVNAPAGAASVLAGTGGGATVVAGGLGANADDDRDKPIFTFRQVEYICNKMLTEQEEKMRAEYDEILNAKLKEQFDIFNRFSVDQIDRLAKHNNQSALSYLS